MKYKIVFFFLICSIIFVFIILYKNELFNYDIIGKITSVEFYEEEQVLMITVKSNLFLKKSDSKVIIDSRTKFKIGEDEVEFPNVDTLLEVGTTVKINIENIVGLSDPPILIASLVKF